MVFSSVKNVLRTALLLGVCYSGAWADEAYTTQACEDGWSFIYDLESKVEQGEDITEAAIKQVGAKALASFQKATKTGKTCGYEGLGYLYEKGYGVKKNRTKAIQLYQKVANKGYGIGYGRIARLFQNNEKKMLHYLDLCRKAPHSPGGEGRDDKCALAAGLIED
ncbi:SEL1-like repeat protein [Helicobacter salomonis]|uniref:sel1 repeat family protein n=1 Tax=Helicobacter salomonis TaxID=56878 RepID=UPI000CF082C8|nr:sel1 repeat family protein [Helicobacter salomonis]